MPFASRSSSVTSSPQKWCEAVVLRAAAITRAGSSRCWRASPRRWPERCSSSPRYHYQAYSGRVMCRLPQTCTVWEMAAFFSEGNQHIMQPAWGNLEVLRLQSDYLRDDPEPRMEELCLWLERSFSAAASSCECCKQVLTKRCVWSMNAKGLHRCRVSLLISGQQRLAPLWDPACFRWRSGCLYDS